MKSLLLIVILGVTAFLCWRAYDQERTARAEVERQVAEGEQQIAALTAKASAERDATIKERDLAIQERDDARQQAVAAQAEVARLTNTTPKPQSWLQKRLEEGSGKLDAPAAPAAVVRKSQVGPNPPQPPP